MRIFLPLAIGIFIGQYLKLPILWSGIVLVLFVLMLWVTKSISPKYHYRWIWGLAWQLTIAFCGVCLLQLNDTSKRADFSGKYVTSDVRQFIATIDEPLVAKQKSYKANAKISLVDSLQNVVQLAGKVILYLQPGDKTSTLKYGSQILINAQLKEISNSPNPGAFDYKAYCARQGIYHQAYLRDSSFVVLPQNKGHWFREFLFDSRNTMHRQLAEIFANNPKALGLSEALITGYRGDLDKEIVEHFANTGVVHVIAISGMHLALIFVLLQLLLKPLAKMKYLVFARHVIVLCGIWFFCLMTGAAPSAVRAAIMLTVLVIGQIGDRKSPIVNSLAFAATLQLVIDPYSLWNVGFQLSYAAVLSIGIFYKPLASLVWHRFAVFNKIGQLASVTIAAQILTFPIALYHFHQMPVYFLLSNIVVVPVITLVLYALLFVLSLSVFVPVGWLGSAIAWLIHKTIAYVQWVNALPGNRVADVLVSPLQLMLMFMASGCIALWLMHKKAAALIWSLGVLLFIMVNQTVQRQRILKQQQLVFYQVPGYHALDIQSGSSALFIGDSILHEEGFLKRFHLMPSRIAMQSFPDSAFFLNNKDYTAITYSGVRLLFVNNSPDFNSISPLDVDWLVPGNSFKGDPQRLLKRLSPKGIIIDGATPEYRYNRWRKAADSLHLRLHIIQRDGPFVLHHR